MAKSLRDKTISGISWSMVETLATKVVALIVFIILSRLLEPAEFGLAAMAMVIVSISDSFVDSGFGNALIWKKKSTQIDYSTVFFFNIIISIIATILVLLFAENIALFFNEIELTPIIQVTSFLIIVNALSLIQRTLLIKEVDFKSQMKISFSAVTISGITSVILAALGYGVWSLIIQYIVQKTIISTLLIYVRKWRPSLIFSYSSFKELYAYGSRIFLTGLLSTLYKNIYEILIGKYFSAADLGIYSRANKMKEISSNQITFSIQKVTFPVLARLQDDLHKMKQSVKKLLINISFLVFSVMTIIIVTAEPLIHVLIGDQWLQAVPYLQLLCIGGLIGPMQAINQNVLKATGYSGKILTIEIIKKTSLILIVFIAIPYGIKGMIIGYILSSILGYVMYSHSAGKLIDYKIVEQLRDAYSCIISCVITGILVYSLVYLNISSNLNLLLLQLLIFGVVLTLIAKTIKLEIFKITKGYVQNLKFMKSI